MGQRFRHGIFCYTLCCLFLLGAAKEALPSTDNPPFRPVRDLKVSDVFISPEFGYIVETHLPRIDHQPVIFHIQEAHTNYEAQQHLARMLEECIERYGVRLLLVEGGQGNMGLSYLRHYGPPANRREVADSYLRLGVISGEEYLDIVSDVPLTLWGVEAQPLYQRQLQTFLEAEALREVIAPTLESLRDALKILTPRLSPPALQELETNAHAFDAATLGLTGYVGFLRKVASRQRLDLTQEAYPHLSRFLEVRKLEQTIALEQVARDQRTLLETLTTRAPAEAVEALRSATQQERAGAISKEMFYARLEEVATTAGVSLKGVPALARYLQYLKELAQIHPDELGEELDHLTAQCRMALASSPESRQLIEVSEEVQLMDRLVQLQLSPTEYRRLTALNLPQALAEAVAFVSDQLSRHGLPSRTFPSPEIFSNAVPVFQRFYEIAQARDAAIVENVMAKLHETHEPVAVLITGGFHAPEITQGLKDQGVGLVAVTVKVEASGDDRLYRAVMRYKTGHGSFEELVAIAGEGSTRESSKDTVR